MIVYLTAWIAMTAYFASYIAAPRSAWRARFWTVGWLAFLLHVAAAFHFVHHWDHAAAVSDTSRRAIELTGSPAPNAIYFNHVFTLVWTFDVAWLWLARSSYDRRPWWIAWAIQGFMLFMVVNAAIVFAANPRRWFGVAALMAATIAVVRRMLTPASSKSLTDALNPPRRVE